MVMVFKVYPSSKNSQAITDNFQCFDPYDPTLLLKLAADASQYGLGTVISHMLPGGDERPIAFASRSLSKSEQNHAQRDKEALALIFGVKKFHAYIFGRKFTLVTDHQSLTTILGLKRNPLRGSSPVTEVGNSSFSIHL